MDGYPDSGDEFELMYGDELEILRQQEEDIGEHTAGPKSRKSLNFTTPTQKKSQSKSNSTFEPQASTSKAVNNSFESDFRALDTDNDSGTKNQEKITTNNFEKDLGASDTDLNTRKRGIEDLFGDIDDILLEDSIFNRAKKRKNGNDDTVIIEKILQARKIAKDKQNPRLAFNGTIRACSTEEHIKNNLSYRVPKYPFIAVTRQDGERIYVRMHSEEYEMEDIKRLTNNSNFTGLMGNQFRDIWAKANQIINQNLEGEKSDKTDEVMEVEITDNSKLWVDMYKPRKYLELLSDESTNRTLLRWLKLWDKVVFNRKPKAKQPLKSVPEWKNPNFKKKELETTLDEHDRPLNKVALLCGPPGLGKTTLAHLVAKHAGYYVVEINASDERNIESFKTALENATQMTSVVDKEKRPNCLVFDEIDGAPASSIEYLIKFINGTASKAKKGKNKKNLILKRPIICICNDVYVPALRPLRQIAFVLNFPPTASSRLAGRLQEICRLQNIKTNLGAMITLSEKTNNDIRSCLSVLHFFKTKDKPVTLSEVYKATVGQKNVQKGLFAVWQDIFEIKKARFNSTNVDIEPEASIEDDMSMGNRMKNVLSSVQSFGDYDRLAQGVFENFIAVKKMDVDMVPTSEALEWFCYTDCVSRKIQETQNYMMYSYLPYGFVVWHFVFAKYTREKISYPTAGNEATSKLNKHNALVFEIMRGMRPQFRPYVTPNSLTLDFLPILSIILKPSLRTVNASLYGSEEKEKITQVVNIMIDYNLTYSQERTQQGAYVYKIDPNIDDIVNFEGLKTDVRALSYTTQQIISREIELEKMRRLDKMMYKGDDETRNVEKMDVNKENLAENKVEKVGKKVEEKEAVLPNFLQKLKAKALDTTKEQVTKDFFGRIITKPVKPKFGDTSGPGFTNDIWFQYKEGHNNAVRRKLTINNFL